MLVVGRTSAQVGGFWGKGRRGHAHKHAGQGMQGLLLMVTKSAGAGDRPPPLDQATKWRRRLLALLAAARCLCIRMHTGRPSWLQPDCKYSPSDTLPSSVSPACGTELNSLVSVRTGYVQWFGSIVYHWVASIPELLSRW